jgi:hypothetical protein
MRSCEVERYEFLFSFKRYLQVLDGTKSSHLNALVVDTRVQAGFSRKLGGGIAISFDDEVVEDYPIEVTTREGKEQKR